MAEMLSYTHMAQGIVEDAIGRLGTMRWSTQLLLGILGFLPIFTKLVSTLQFYSTRSKRSSVVPVAPYWIPGLHHLIPFLWDTAEFPRRLVNRYGWQQPIKFKAGPVEFTVVANPEHIIAVNKNSRHLSARSITERSARYLLDIPPRIILFYQADDSGMAAEIRKGSSVAPEDRILYHQVHTSLKFLASPYLEPLSQRYLTALHRAVDALDIGAEWTAFPDLYHFCQTTATRANIEAMCGTKILELSPDLVPDFWVAKDYAPEYFRGWPRWLVPAAFAARDRVIDAVQRWHEFALGHGDYTTTGAQDPDWEPVWGSRYLKSRYQYMAKMKPFTARVKASEDWGLMFGANGNTAPVVFWYLFEALKDPSLRARMVSEASECISVAGDIDIRALLEQPLLQSCYAEVCRLRVSILVSRIVEWQDVVVDGYTLRRGEFIVMPTDAVHFNSELWTRAGFPPTRVPLEEFDADRFLISSQCDTGTGEDSQGEKKKEREKKSVEFNQDGLSGVWIPFGGGDRMCPGRHVAKVEMLVTFAFLFSKFDIEALPIDFSKVNCDRRYAAFGVLPPKGKVPFRIRRKM